MNARRPVAFVGLLAASVAYGAGAAYRDPLEVPAARSTLAARSPLAAVTRAGDRLVAVGMRGHVLVSRDGGKTWDQAAVPLSSDLTSVWFTTPERGWAVGHDGVVLETTDAGKTWAKRLDGREAAALIVAAYEARAAAGDAGAATALEDARRLVADGPDKPFLDVWFEDERTGFVIGAFNLILGTSDGGRTWEPWLDRVENPKALHLYAMRGAAGDVLVVGEQGLVLRLDRAARRFVAVESPYRGTFFGVAMKPGAAVAFGLRGNAFRSIDGGRTWKKVETHIETGILGGTALPDGRFVLASQGGQLLVSADDGRTFAPARLEKPMAFAAVTHAAPGEIALVGLLGARVEKLP